MTSESDLPHTRKPRRAEPLQPDRPNRGRNVEPQPDESPHLADERALERERAALDNVRTGGQRRKDPPEHDAAMTPPRPAGDAQ